MHLTSPTSSSAIKWAGYDQDDRNHVLALVRGKHVIAGFRHINIQLQVRRH